MQQSIELKSENQQKNKRSYRRVWSWNGIPRPVSILNRFAKDHQEIKNRKEIRDLWEETTADDREKYELEYKEQKEVFDRLVELTKHKQKLEKELKETEDKLTEATSQYLRNTKPKKGKKISAFSCFFKEQDGSLKETKPELKYKERSKELKAVWKELGVDERKQYYELAKEKRKQLISAN